MRHHSFIFKWLRNDSTNSVVRGLSLAQLFIWVFHKITTYSDNSFTLRCRNFHLKVNKMWWFCEIAEYNIWNESWEPPRCDAVYVSIFINPLISLEPCIWTPMLWVYGHYKYFTLSLRGPTLYARIWRLDSDARRFNPIKPEFTIVIFIHYKPRIAVAILDL